ncbi:MAG TPA: hypothetical protein VFW20_02705, partial [Candidatus Limnocylindrales bacterium]|nr:hypothetical protein [Candidatus Limnocylindrales bacterium]
MSSVGRERAAALTRDGVRSSLRVLLSNRSLLGNAASLFGSTVLTGGLGAVYWAIAARLFTPESVGVAAAAISS